MLLKAGANVHAQDALPELKTKPLTLNWTQTQMLLKAGANVHAEDAQGYTPQDDAEVAPFGTGPKKKFK